jgi:hypothetical protein
MPRCINVMHQHLSPPPTVHPRCLPPVLDRTTTPSVLWVVFTPIGITASVSLGPALVISYLIFYLQLCRNREERNKQTRERMARLRAREATLPREARTVRQEARREATRRYREKCMSSCPPILITAIAHKLSSQEPPSNRPQSARGPASRLQRAGT